MTAGSDPRAAAAETGRAGALTSVQGGDSVTFEAAETLLGRLAFNEAGLVTAVAQQVGSGEVLMLAWMSPDSIRESLRTGRAVYYSRSRQALWPKGETSGHVQWLLEVRVDCDGDALLLMVDQQGPACHTGRRSCFYRIAGPDGVREIMAPLSGAEAG